MHVRVAEIAARHDGLVTWSALRAAGLSERQARRAVAELRRLHEGVFLTGLGRVTDHQRWLAATLTVPGTVLSHGSAGAARTFWPDIGAFEVVTRAGTGGPRRSGDLLVCRSALAPDEVTVVDGIPMTTPARTIIDLCAHLDQRRRAKVVREAIRLGVMTALELRLAAARHPGAAGNPRAWGACRAPGAPAVGAGAQRRGGAGARGARGRGRCPAAAERQVRG
jgi:hypothetical protein